jgi:hypothetical protein
MEAKDIKEGDVIEWELLNYLPNHNEGRYMARVAMIDPGNKCFGVYAIYGQDLIPFDKVISHFVSNDNLKEKEGKFAEWCSENDWIYDDDIYRWCKKYNQIIKKTTSELMEEYKIFNQNK